MDSTPPTYAETSAPAAGASDSGPGWGEPRIEAEVKLLRSAIVQQGQVLATLHAVVARIEGTQLRILENLERMVMASP